MTRLYIRRFWLSVNKLSINKVRVIKHYRGPKHKIKPEVTAHPKWLVHGLKPEVRENSRTNKKEGIILVVVITSVGSEKKKKRKATTRKVFVRYLRSKEKKRNTKCQNVGRVGGKTSCLIEKAEVS